MPLNGSFSFFQYSEVERCSKVFAGEHTHTACENVQPQEVSGSSRGLYVKECSESSPICWAAVMHFLWLQAFMHSKTWTAARCYSLLCSLLHVSCAGQLERAEVKCFPATLTETQNSHTKLHTDSLCIMLDLHWFTQTVHFSLTETSWMRSRKHEPMFLSGTEKTGRLKSQRALREIY